MFITPFGPLMGFYSRRTLSQHVRYGTICSEICYSNDVNLSHVIVGKWPPCPSWSKRCLKSSTYRHKTLMRRISRTPPPGKLHSTNMKYVHHQSYKLHSHHSGKTVTTHHTQFEMCRGRFYIYLRPHSSTYNYNIKRLLIGLMGFQVLSYHLVAMVALQKSG